MTPKSKQRYIKLIHELWPTTKHYTADDVNEEAAQIVDYVIDEIVRVCRPIAIFEALIKNIIPLLIHKNPRDIAQDLYELFRDLLDAVRGNRRYKFIANRSEERREGKSVRRV